MQPAPRVRLFVGPPSDDHRHRFRLVSAEPDWIRASHTPGLRFASCDALSAPLRRAIGDARLELSEQQQFDGSFLAKRSGDPRAHGQFILLSAWFGLLDSEDVRRCARELLVLQQSCGGWSRRPGAPVDVGTSVLAYFALKVAGHESHQEPMQSARRFLLSHGGAEAADETTRIYLAIFGQIPFDACKPCDSDSSDARPILRESVQWLLSARHSKALPEDCSIRELLVTDPARWRAAVPGKRFAAWTARCRRTVHQIRRRLEAVKWPPLRRLLAAHSSRRENRRRRRLLGSLRKASRAARAGKSLTWDSISLSAIARSVGRRGKAGSLPAAARNRLNRLIVRDDDRLLVFEKCDHVRDTAMAVAALCRSGLTLRSCSVRSAVEFLLASHPTAPEDRCWKLRALACALTTDDKSPDALPPELQLCLSEGKPDQADAGLVDLLKRIQDERRALIHKLIESQQADGGWTRSGRNRKLALRRPDSDAATTALVLRALTEAGYRAGLPVIDRAIALLRRQQQPNGCWDRPAPVSSISTATSDGTVLSSTANALAALIEAGLPVGDGACQAAVHWLTAHEQPGGGWGERDEQDPDYLPGEGPRSMAATATVIEGLLAAGCGHLDAVTRGVDFLLRPETRDDAADFTVLHAVCRWARDENNNHGHRAENAPALRLASAEPATA